VGLEVDRVHQRFDSREQREQVLPEHGHNYIKEHKAKELVAVRFPRKEFGLMHGNSGKWDEE
jgi:hypothetical protein